MPKHLVFVYGTLKRGFSRDRYLAEQRYLGVGVLCKQYCMYAMGGHPALVRKGTPDWLNLGIHGELYEVSADIMPVLDQIEGTEHNLYAREMVNLEFVHLFQLPLEKNVADMLLYTKEAEAYIYKQDVEGAKNCGAYWSNK